MNKQKLIKNKFEWQDEYIALSVSYSVPIAIGNKVRADILNQKAHHNPARRDAEEYEEFLNAHHFESFG